MNGSAVRDIAMTAQCILPAKHSRLGRGPVLCRLGLRRGGVLPAVACGECDWMRWCQPQHDVPPTPRPQRAGRVRGLVNRLSDENKDAVMKDMVAVSNPLFAARLLARLVFRHRHVWRLRRSMPQAFSPTIWHSALDHALRPCVGRCFKARPAAL